MKSYSAEKTKLGPTLVGDALTSLETSDTKTAELFSQVGRKTASVGEISQAWRAYSVHCFPRVRVRTSSRHLPTSSICFAPSRPTL